MEIQPLKPARKAVTRRRPTLGFADPNIFADRYIMDRYGVSPSLARTIAGLAQLGGRQ